MYYAGIDPYTMKEVPVARRLKARLVQRALLQYWKAENWQTVRNALMGEGREDLIGNGPDCLIPSYPPRIPKGEKQGHSGFSKPKGGYRHASRAGSRRRKD